MPSETKKQEFVVYIKECHLILRTYTDKHKVIIGNNNSNSNYNYNNHIWKECKSNYYVHNYYLGILVQEPQLQQQ